MPSTPHRFYLTDAAVFHVAFHEPDAAPAQVPEAFVQDLWAGRRFDVRALSTTDGVAVVVLDPGRLNTDAGPDFAGARLRIGDAAWAGDVEVHVTSGSWYEHGHDRDPAYDRTVLHVTLVADVWTGHLRRADGTTLPEVVLHPHLDDSVRRLLHAFYTRHAPDPPCADSWSAVPAHLRASWIAALALERVRAARDDVARAVAAGRDLGDVLHERLFAGLGYAKNSAPLSALARRLPLALVRQVAATASEWDLEALHLGTAGLLPAPGALLGADRATADATMDLRDRYDRLRARLGPPPLEAPGWRFFRLRPANFPPLRVAQAAALVRPGGLLFEQPLARLVAAARATEPVDALRATLRAEPTPFWNEHVRLERRTKPYRPALGRTRRDALLVNAVVPVLLCHAEATSDTALEAVALDVLARLPAPNDEVTRRFAALGTRAAHALEGHGLHQLYRTRCTEGRCLACAIGRHLLPPP